MKNTGKRSIGIGVLLFILAMVLCTIPAKRAEAAEKRLVSITAVYTGDTVLVGNSLDLNKLTVMGLYSDGSYSKLKDYALSAYVVEKKGDNLIAVTCDGVTGTFTVKGKEILQLVAYYSQVSHVIGETLDKEKITVYVYYSDATNMKVEDYVLSHTVVAKVGKNEFTVIYGGETAKFSVIGKEEKKPRTIYAMYYGPDIIVGNAPNRDDFYVSVFYTDNTSDQITAFELTPSIIQKEGSNTIIVSYGELSTEVKITGLAKTVVDIKAEYTGLPVVIGTAVSSEDIKVTATFNDGTKDTVTNFTLSSSVVYKIGDNLIMVFCDGNVAYINVRGVEAEIIDYTDGVQEIIREGKTSSRVKIAVGAKVDAEQVLVEKVDKKLVQKAMHRLIQTDEYMAFEVSLADPELDNYLPMTVKVSVPAGYDKKQFAVFYTPNRKTIMAQMNGEFLKDGYYEFKMFQPGTYIIADCTPLIYVESVSLEMDELTLRLDRSYSLDPEILPHTATDKAVTYTSSRPHIVSVSKYGTLKALKTGTSIITIETNDGSGKKCKLRVNVVKKKGKFDADIAELSDALNEVQTADDFIDFIDYYVEYVDEKSYDMDKKTQLRYEEELRSWIGSWDEDTVDLDEEDRLYILELLYERGEYSQALLFFGDVAMSKKEINELHAQLAAIETADDFLVFQELFFPVFDEMLAEQTEEGALLHLMAILNWAYEEEQNLEAYEWEEDIVELFYEWLDELELYGI